MLIGKVLTSAANGLCAVQRHIEVSPARAAPHLARQTDGALRGNRFKVSFMLALSYSNERGDRQGLVMPLVKKQIGFMG